MPGTLQLQIITPDKIVLDTPVDRVTATAIDGELSILPNHEPLITALAIDVLKYTVGSQEEIVAVLGGLLEVGENKITVLSDTADLGHDINEAQAKEDKEKAEADKTQKTDKLDAYMTEMALSKAMARLRAAELTRRRRGRLEN